MTFPPKDPKKRDPKVRAAAIALAETEREVAA